MENTQVKELERSSINTIQSAIMSTVRDYHLEKVHANIICNISGFTGDDNLAVLRGFLNPNTPTLEPFDFFE